MPDDIEIGDAMNARIGGVLLWCAILSSFASARAASIGGTVTGSDGVTPLNNICAQTYLWSGTAWSYASCGYTGSNGQYEVAGLAAGMYRLRFVDWNATYLGEVYDNVLGDNYDSSGTNIVVAEEAAVSGINASLAVASKIRGTVTGPDGMTPVANIYVSAYRWQGSSWTSASYNYTESNGSYMLGNLAAGTYRVTFSDWRGAYVGEVYDNVPGTAFSTSGTNIVVSEGATVWDINASLATASKISGTVTGPDGVLPLQNIDVYAYRQVGSEWSYVSYDYTDSDGFYEVGGLAAGTYRVTFRDWTGMYVGEVYDNVPGAAYSASGTNIVVPAAATVPNINASLDEYASLEGAVTRASDGSPLSGVSVHMVGMVNGMTYSDATDENGAYLFAQVVPGDYAVRTAPTTNSGVLGQWYMGVLHIPGQDVPPPAAMVIVVDSGEAETDVDFALDLAGRITGTVTGNTSIAIAGGRVKAKNGTYGLVYETQTDAVGMYELKGLLPGSYTIKAGADLFQDEWYLDAIHEDLATGFPVAIGDDLSIDFDLAPGQSPALVQVTSDPSGATIYLDFQPTTNVTPAVLVVGEIGDWDWAGYRIASHAVSVKKAGRPRPSPQYPAELEAETVAVHFDMTANTSGSVAVATTPGGAMVFADCADIGEGLSPVTIGNLAPGSHTILLGKSGCLHPRPVVVQVQEGLTNAITVPLASNTAPDRLIADVRSVPPGAAIYVDYLPATNVTDVIVDWMDPASHGGAGWQSASHTIMLRENGFLPAAPRYVPDLTNQTQLMVVHLGGDPVTAVDDDHDGLPDPWEDAYDLRTRFPGAHGADDDADGDGLTNEEEMRLGTNPLLSASALEFEGPDSGRVGTGAIHFVIDTVPGKAYLVQVGSLAEGPWHNVGGLICATSNRTECDIAIPPEQTRGFYRMVLVR